MAMMILLYTSFRGHGMGSHGRGINNNLKMIAMTSKEKEKKKLCTNQNMVDKVTLW